jgi:hypothetical protein
MTHDLTKKLVFSSILPYDKITLLAPINLGDFSEENLPCKDVSEACTHLFFLHLFGSFYNR